LEDGNVFLHSFAVDGLFSNWNMALDRYFQELSNAILQKTNQAIEANQRIKTIYPFFS